MDLNVLIPTLGMVAVIAIVTVGIVVLVRGGPRPDDPPRRPPPPPPDEPPVVPPPPTGGSPAPRPEPWVFIMEKVLVLPKRVKEKVKR